MNPARRSSRGSSVVVVLTGLTVVLMEDTSLLTVPSLKRDTFGNRVSLLLLDISIAITRTSLLDFLISTNLVIALQKKESQISIKTRSSHNQ
jgi:hypothetical protein